MIVTALLLGVTFQAQQLVASLPRVPLPKPAPGAPMATSNRNHTGAGVLKNGVLTLELDVVASGWRPEGNAAPAIPVFAFAEKGSAPSVPGPMIRVPQGTEVRIVLNSRIDSALTIGGLRPGSATDTVSLPAHGTKELRYRLGAPGTYWYWGARAGTTWADRYWIDSQLNGAIIVDAPGAPTDDQVLLMSEWFLDYPVNRPFEVIPTINGNGWPDTERLTIPLHKRTRFRVINTTALHHPMHLHGAYYTIEARGTGGKDGPIPKALQPFLNTDLLKPGGTMTMSFTLDKPGNWLFHCHFSFHMDESSSLKGSPEDSAAAARLAASHGSHAMADGGDHHMAGLVVGLVVPAPPGYVEPAATSPRNLRLLAQMAPNRLFNGAPAFGFVLQDGNNVPAKDSVLLPGSVLELVRGKPVRITVVNNLNEPTGIHWHGLEIPSYPDGVPNWSGMGDRLFRPIAPRDSFIAEFTPPRAGTFPYHSHLNERHQIQSGMYSAIIVTDTPRDPKHDHLIVAGGGGPPLEAKLESPFALVNGKRSTDPIRIVAGELNRFRLLSVHPDWRISFTLRNDSTVARWRAVAKDGATLPPAQATMRPASIHMGPGETADFEFRAPTAGTWLMEVRSAEPGWYIPLEIIVEPAKRNRG